jgi:polyisoprenoid-binding protein YceI
MHSFDLGDAEFNKEVSKKTWFNTPQYPKARFMSTSIKSSGSGKLEALGKLSIKGITTDVSMSISIKKEGATYIFDGALPIKRLTYAIGEGEWKDTSMVADEVLVKFHLVGTP